MNIILILLITVLTAVSTSLHAGIVVGGTRLIYDGNKKESSLNVTNPDKIPYLIQSWVEKVESSSAPLPFIITPPLFRLDGGQANVLRVIHTGGDLPPDRESLYWLNIKSIPSVARNLDQNTLQIAIRTRIKLIYRPKDLNGSPESEVDKLTWQITGNVLQVTNPTPFYMNFHSVQVAGKEVPEATYVAPMSSARFAMPKGGEPGQVRWAILNDYGGTGKTYTQVQ